MKKSENFRHTMIACYVGYVTQAIVVNFAPLLFLTFQRTYDLRLQQITLLVTVNFLVQLLVDFLASRYVDKLGYRPCILAAHLLTASGLVGLAVLPELFASPLTGLLTAVVIYAAGSGIIEVLISPIAEACPTENKESAMSLLHAFYSWGCVITIVGSTVLFAILGTERWRLISCLWALVPLYNFFAFLRAPIARIVEEDRTMSVGDLLRQRVFWMILLVILSSGAAEHAVAQWASSFAESGLGVSKTVGDLAGPCLFAILMGLARTLHGKIADHVPLETCMTGSAALAIVAYGLMLLSVSPLVSLFGCALCGFAVGIFWPGALSIAARRIPLGGTAMFALLALAGDAGCSLGPSVVGFVSGLFGDHLRFGIGAAIVFPLIVFIGVRLLRPKKTKCDTIR